MLRLNNKHYNLHEYRIQPLCSRDPTRAKPPREMVPFEVKHLLSSVYYKAKQTLFTTPPVTQRRHFGFRRTALARTPPNMSLCATVVTFCGCCCCSAKLTPAPENPQIILGATHFRPNSGRRASVKPALSALLDARGVGRIGEGAFQPRIPHFATPSPGST